MSTNGNITENQVKINAVLELPTLGYLGMEIVGWKRLYFVFCILGAQAVASGVLDYMMMSSDRSTVTVILAVTLSIKIIGGQSMIWLHSLWCSEKAAGGNIPIAGNRINREQRIAGEHKLEEQSWLRPAN